MNDEYLMFSLFPIKLSPEAGVFPVAKIKENTVLKNRLFLQRQKRAAFKSRRYSRWCKTGYCRKGCRRVEARRNRT